MNDKLKKFQSLIKEIFQFEASDLDFGIYRILNYKRDRIEKFIKEDLKNKVETAFAKHKDERLTNIEQRFEKVRQNVIEAFGQNAFTPTGELKEKFKDTPLGKEFLSIKAQKDEAQAIDEIKSQVFNDLYNFFSRYYEEGDFIPQYRYFVKGHKYAIPYNGEEVKLYWANSGQYYTKTGLLFRDYTFKAGDYKVIFRIVSAKEELGSNKATKERFFILDDYSPSLKGCQAKPDGVVHWKDLPYNPELKEKAKELRKAGNLAEVLFWKRVKNKQFLGLDFDRQKVIGNYIVDFFCKNLGFVVEIDGRSHDFKGGYDEERDRYLRSLGLKVFHIPDKEIRENLDGVLEWLKEEIRNTPSAAADTPLKEGNTSSANTDTPLKEGKGIIIRFQYRELTEEEVKHYDIEGGSNTAKQEKINQKSYDEIFKEIKDITLKGFLEQPKNEKPLLLYHINRFTAKNTKDYFIHKNLKKFLLEQLDYFIKSEVLDIETLEKERFLDKHITRAKVVREIGEDIIDFLSQIEDFQKKLWEKKKFVLKTEYVITTDRIPEEFYEEIWKNEEQRKEWEELGFEIPKTKEELKDKKLPIDTEHFSQEFKEKLLEKLTENADLDDLLDGLLIKSENWQALNTILEKYRGSIKTIYIDPPYNTGSDGFLYRDRYQHSSWLSMMENRLSLAKKLMTESGCFCSHIDDNEVANMRFLLDTFFYDFDFYSIAIITNPRGRRGEKISKTHEYIMLCIAKSIRVSKKELSESKNKPFLKTGKESERETGRNCFYPIYVDSLKKTIVRFGDVPPDDFHPPKAVIEKYDNEIEIWPITKDGKERKWRYARQSVEEIKDKLYIKDLNSGANSIYLEKEEENFKSVWTEEYHNIAEYGTNLLKNLCLPSEFIYPKSLFTAIDIIKLTSGNYNNAIILDFFAGSGTTAHAVMKLNKEDGGKRKFILVEMADYFDTVIIPRIKKVAYSFNWKDGKPQDTDGIGVFFKYQILEQYEDTLDNIELKENQKAKELFKDDYLLKYFLDFETRESPYLLNIDGLKNPFAYKLKVNLSEVGEPQEVVVDIPETFNYLLGLKVKKVKTRTREDNNKKYLFILGEKGGKDIAIVWREYDEGWSDEDFKKDKEFIIEELSSWSPNIVYINGQSTLTPTLGENTVEICCIESAFKRLMEE